MKIVQAKDKFTRAKGTMKRNLHDVFNVEIEEDNPAAKRSKIDSEKAKRFFKYIYAHKYVGT